MITNSFVNLLMTGKIDLDTAQVKVLLLTREPNLTVRSSSAANIANNSKWVVIDSKIPTGGIDAKIVSATTGIKLVMEPSVMKMSKANWVVGVLVHLVGTYGNVDMPIVSFAKLPPDYYYNVTMLTSGEYLIKYTQ